MLCHNVTTAIHQIHDSDFHRQGWGELGKCNEENISQIILLLHNTLPRIPAVSVTCSQPQSRSN